MLCIGGIDLRVQLDTLKRGVHIVVATPGRLKDLLNKRRMNLDICRSGIPVYSVCVCVCVCVCATSTLVCC
jgi:hypothetical protein